MSHETDQIAKKALERAADAPLEFFPETADHEDMENPRYLRGRLDGYREAYQDALGHVLEALLQDRR